MSKLAFTGSAATARKVLAAAAETLTPVLAECGGKDALLVAADADLDAAADAATWGAMSNAGQTCIGIERVYVVDGVYHSFLEKLNERVSRLRPGDDGAAAYGPMTLPGQIDVVERHLADAVARGGRPAYGGLDSVRAPFVQPVVLVDVPEESSAPARGDVRPGRDRHPGARPWPTRSGWPTRRRTRSGRPCSPSGGGPG